MRRITIALSAALVVGSCSDEPPTGPYRVGVQSSVGAGNPEILSVSANDPQVSVDDRILFDTRSALQAASTLREALAIWGYQVDTRPQWGFTTDLDGVGTHALRVDWPSGGDSCDNLMPDVAKTLPQPYPRRVYMQWKHRLGRSATGGGLGDVGAFDVHRPECGNTGRFVWMAKRDNTSDRIELKWVGPEPARPIIKSRGKSYEIQSGLTFDPQAHVGETLLHTLYVEAESSPGASDGVLRLWINGQLLIDRSGLPIGSQAVYRVHFPWSADMPRDGQSEYFWDIVVWEPTDSPTDPPADPDRLVITPATVQLLVSETAQFTASRVSATGDVVSIGALTWLSLQPTTATISASGMATGMAAGTTDIVATTVDGLADTAQVTVAAQPPDDPPPSPGTRAGHYAAPDGTSAGDGSAARPWDIKTALAGASGRIQPGDTLWVRGGRYMGPFTSTLVGSSAAPIIVRAYPGERATLDNQSTSLVTLKAASEWVWYWGLETQNSNPSRLVFRPNCVYPTKPNNKFINLIIHDCQVGMSFSNESKNSEVYGAIIYNNGYVGSDRTHGHGIYTKNDGTTPKVIRDNVVFNSFRNGIQIYTDAGSGQLRGIHLEGNVFFNNGVLSSNSSASANILIGGYEVADRITALGNMTFYSPTVTNRSARLGYSNTLENGSLVFSENYLVGGTPMIDVGYWRQLAFTGNTLVGSAEMVALRDPSPIGHTWQANVHVRDPLSRSWRFGSTLLDFLGWKAATGLANGDAVQLVPPSQPRIFVRPNVYEPGRAHIIVYNWGRSGTVGIDVSGVLSAGDLYELRNVQDLWGQPLVSGTYGGGAISVPTLGVAPPAPIGGAPNAAPRTGPDFDVFLLTRRPH